MRANQTTTNGAGQRLRFAKAPRPEGCGLTKYGTPAFDADILVGDVIAAIEEVSITGADGLGTPD